jgi:hypothetical protein
LSSFRERILQDRLPIASTDDTPARDAAVARYLPLEDRDTVMSRTLVAALVLLGVVITAPVSVLDARTSPRDMTPRLRPLDAEMRELVRVGFQLSPSLRALAEQVERSDVVVYLKVGRLPQRMDGQLTFLSTAAGLRYVMVEIAWERSEVRRISTLGHELQHVLEIAERPDIVDAESMARAYSHFGVQRERQRTGWQAFDTDAAMDAGLQVWKEVTGAAAADD